MTERDSHVNATGAALRADPLGADKLTACIAAGGGWLVLDGKPFVMGPHGEGYAVRPATSDEELARFWKQVATARSREEWDAAIRPLSDVVRRRLVRMNAISESDGR